MDELANIRGEVQGIVDVLQTELNNAVESIIWSEKLRKEDAVTFEARRQGLMNSDAHASQPDEPMDGAEY